ncbi:hypothetical protein [Beijerinckia mobilis]|uniref:hypothetical protein n=1 Tax=Beijerinckia mobilis TaxID=231434 RepID=UPI0012EBD09C|nr:hypothetical protein [Beijerinckia mobilis]
MAKALAVPRAGHQRPPLQRFDFRKSALALSFDRAMRGRIRKSAFILALKPNTMEAGQILVCTLALWKRNQGEPRVRGGVYNF